MSKLTAKTVTWSDWSQGTRPFDNMNCGDCMTMHRRPCGNPAHDVVTKSVRKELGLLANLQYPDDRNAWVKKYFPKFLALRKKFAKFYPKEAK